MKIENINDELSVIGSEENKYLTKCACTYETNGLNILQRLTNSTQISEVG